MPPDIATPTDNAAGGGFFSRIGNVLKTIAPYIGPAAARVAAAYHNYGPLEYEQQQRQFGLQSQLANSQLENQALQRQRTQQEIDFGRSPEQMSEMELNRAKAIADYQRQNAPSQKTTGVIGADAQGTPQFGEFGVNPYTNKAVPVTIDQGTPEYDAWRKAIETPGTPENPNGTTLTPPEGAPGRQLQVPPPNALISGLYGAQFGPPVYDASKGAFVRDVTNKFGQSRGQQTLSGTPVNALPSTSSGYSTTLKPDINGNLVSVTEPRSTTTQKVLPQTPQGTSSAPSSPFPKSGGAPRGAKATPVTDAQGNPVHGPLSADARKNISQIETTQRLMDSVLPELDARIKQSGGNMNSLWDGAMQRAAWAEYSHGGVVPNNIDPTLAHLLPTIAQLQIVGGLPYLRGTRSFQYIQQIQQHLPNPEKDSPALMVDKLHSLQQTMPILRQSVIDSEINPIGSVNGPTNGPQTPNKLSALPPGWH